MAAVCRVHTTSWSLPLSVAASVAVSDTRTASVTRPLSSRAWACSPSRPAGTASWPTSCESWSPRRVYSSTSSARSSRIAARPTQPHRSTLRTSCSSVSAPSAVAASPSHRSPSPGRPSDVAAMLASAAAWPANSGSPAPSPSICSACSSSRGNSPLKYRPSSSSMRSDNASGPSGRSSAASDSSSSRRHASGCPVIRRATARGTTSAARSLARPRGTSCSARSSSARASS